MKFALPPLKTIKGLLVVGTSVIHFSLCLLNGLGGKCDLKLEEITSSVHYLRRRLHRKKTRAEVEVEVEEEEEVGCVSNDCPSERLSFLRMSVR